MKDQICGKPVPRMNPPSPAWLATLGRTAGFLVLTSSLGACSRTGPPPPVSNRLPSSWTGQTPLPVVRAAPPVEVTAAIRAMVDGGVPGVAPSSDERMALESIYQASFEPLLWVDASFRPSGNAREVLKSLGDAASDGLEAADYHVEWIASLGRKLAAASPPEPRDVASFDVALSLSMMRYLRHLHRGRVDPREIGFLMNIPPDEHQYAALVRNAALQSQVKTTIETLTPPLVQYQILRAVLPRYRALAEDPTLRPLPPMRAKSFKPGDTVPGLDLIRTRLVAMGDLPENAAAPGNPALYEGEMVLGVKKFQARHGLEEDGVLGKTTWALLNVPLSQRLRQIELAMERMRWLPHLGERPFVAVNIPMFRLWGWDSVPESGAPTFEMGVIVGKALDTRTPVFVEEMEYVIFRPYWNVPKSIVQTEILPQLRRDLGYLNRQEMEMVEGESDEAKPVAPTSDNVNRLARGEVRLRQRPGPKNALGDVKFIFPNDDNVYLHSTPAPDLFDRARRDFSHGCVRVEDPVGLAVWALQDQPEWSRERITAAMKGGAPSLRVPLTRPIRVVLYYVTATVIPRDGAIHFAADIYGQDPVLDQALTTRRSAGAD
jgi:murein L,D-transpeptidase YcbB/YkuD